MTAVVIDGTDTDAIVNDAQTIPGQPVPRGTSEGEKKSEAKTDTKVEAKEAPKEAKAESKEDPDDVQDEEGLTPREKRELTEKMQRAIAKRTRALRDAEEFAAEQYNERRMAEQRAEAFQREINRLKEQQPKEPVKNEKPVRENFKTDEEFRDALDDYRVEMKFREREAALEKQRQEERQEQIRSAAIERIEKAKELVPDYEDVVATADVEVPSHIAGYMQESEMFAELGYHFAKHPEDLARLAKMPARTAADLVRVGLALSKIEGTLEPFSATPKVDGKANGEAPEPKPSQNGAPPSTERVETRAKPPAPIRPLNQVSQVQVEKPEAEMSAKEAMAAWQQKRHINLKQRQRH